MTEDEKFLMGEQIKHLSDEIEVYKAAIINLEADCAICAVVNAMEVTACELGELLYRYHHEKIIEENKQQG